ncbi:putative mitochondrial carrier domain superfamily [Helianthus anomalus]
MRLIFGSVWFLHIKLDKTKFYVTGAGIFTELTVGLYPISVVKTRMQVTTKDSVEKSAYAVIRGLLNAEGTPSSAVCMLGHGNDGDGSIPSQGTIVMVQGAGGISAADASSLITTPLVTIKTRLQVHLIFSLNIVIETITI